MTDEPQKREIVIGINDDGSLYFDVSNDIQPHEAVGMVRWLQVAIETNIERQYMIGGGGALEAAKGIISETRNIHNKVMLSHEKVLKALELTSKGVMGVIGAITNREDKTEAE